MRRILLILATLLATLSIACAAAPGPDREEKRGGEAPAVTVTAKSFQSVTEELEATLEIPVLSGLPDKELEKRINADLENKALNFKSEIEKAAAEYYADAREHGWEVPGPCVVHTSYTVPYNKDGYLSLCVTYYGFSGGAHGNTHMETLNLDTRTGKTLLLKDFFEPGEDWQSLVAEEIRRQIAERPQEFFDDAADRVKTIPEDQPFYIKDGAVVVYFGQYEIAPYATGMPEFEIPVSAMP